MRRSASEKRIPCGFFSLEMPYESIGMRLLAQEARVPMQKIRSGMLKVDDVKKIQDAAGRWFEAPLYTVDTPNMKLIDVRAVARRMVKNQGVKIIFIDKDDDTKTADMLANETGAKIYVLNSGMNGTSNLNSYIDVMKENYNTLKLITEE